MDGFGSTLRSRALAVLCGAATLLPCVADAQTVPPWRAQLETWCGGGSSAPACARLAGLDPGANGPERDRAALLVADVVARQVAPLMLDRTSHAVQAQALRNLSPLESRSAASVALGALLEAWVGLLPPRARPLTRGLAADTWWTGLERLAADREWSRTVRDDGSPSGLARAHLVQAATLIDRGVFQGADVATLLDGLAALVASVEARGAPRDELVRTVVELVEALPRRSDAAPAGPPDLPSRQDVNAAMDAVRPAIARCVGVMDTVVRVRFVFDHTGRVSEATTEGEHAGTMIGSCARTAALGVSLPPFERPTMSVLFPFRVFGAHPDQATANALPPEPTTPPAMAAPDSPPLPPPPPSTDAAPLPAQPFDSDIDMALASAEDPVRACLARAHPITVTLVISGDGEVQRASAAGAGNAEATSCVEGALMNVHFPQFTTPTVSVTRRILARRR